MQAELFEKIEVGKLYELGDEVMRCKRADDSGMCVFSVEFKAGKKYIPTVLDHQHRIVWKNKHKLKKVDNDKIR